MSAPRSRSPWIAAGLGAVAIVGILGLAQLTLPGIAAQRVRDRIAHYGTVRSAHVVATPAIELLWGSAQSVTLNAKTLRLSFAQAAGLLASAAGFDRLDAVVDRLLLGPLAIGSAGIRVRGSSVAIEGNVALSSLRAFLPPDTDMQFVSSGQGAVHIRLRGGVLASSAPLPAVILARQGKLEVEVSGLPAITLFSDPKLAIARLTLSSTGSGTYRLRILGTLR
jgi:hypothetical protein